MLTEKVPAGKITTYGLIASALGTSPRAVGQALKANPDPVDVPCHRVVRSNGEIGGYSRGVRRKIMLLRGEGILIENRRIVDFRDKLFIFQKI